MNTKSVFKRTVHPPIRSKELSKYYFAQVKLREITTPDDGHWLRAFGSYPQDLYIHMMSMGFTWKPYEQSWQLRKGLKEPIWYMFRQGGE